MASGGRRRKPRAGSSRPKAKKRTKYLSLSRIIVKAEAETPPPRDDDDRGPTPPPATREVKKEEDGGGGQGHAEPFALHHEASTLFAALPAPSLSDILGASADSPSSSSLSPSASPGGAGFPGAEEEDLARRALRGRERWVYCCSSPSTTTATSSSASPCSSAASTGASARSLLLKLDYEEILAAWADRGSLYIRDRAASPKPEPELDVLVEVEPPQQEAAAACAWSTPPETVGSDRVERVRRYRQKRLNRLFAKRIRYEVRRVNAVRRPRFKGRFIKEHEEIEVEPT